jgi:RNA polymerase sigma-70 factor (ECF subfamily)
VNNSLSKLKREKKDTLDIDLDKVSDSIIENVESVYQGLTQADQHKFINYALSELCIEDGLLLTLYYLNENTIEEIAEITNISQQTLKMKIHRARKKMYIVLEKRLKSEIHNLL